MPTDVDGRTIVVTARVVGDPGLTVLRVLAAAEDTPPVGAAAHGDQGVATGVWQRPRLYLARWLNGRRRVTGYTLGTTSRLADYVQTEGRVPTRFETDNWYGEVPAEVAEAFLAVDMFVDDPPFAVPAPPPPPRSPAAAPKRSVTRPARAPRPKPEPKPPPPPTTRVCTACYLQKKLAQFRSGSDVCTDCD